MKNDIAISFILSKSLFFGFIMSFILKNSSYLSFVTIILGYLLGYILLNYYINHNLKLNKIILLFIDIILLIYILFNLSYQASNFFLTSTPIILIITLFLIVILYGMTKKIDGVTNLALILFPINVILIILGIIFNIENYSIININSINILYLLINTIIVLFISIIPIIIYINTNSNYNKKYILIGYIISGITLTIISLNCLFSIGPTLLNYYSFPEYMTYKKIHLLNFIERIENIISVYSLIDFTILGIIILINIKTILKKAK